ncbi:hypothetical protein [Streptomyces boncukensis]|uniref:hypothetical protein n=1 Tax=Streptomyces boncukensis TaxID=2711219 RepID=UPI0019D0E368|nr:hypothetical protein [Streptomyces boncukensis]
MVAEKRSAVYDLFEGGAAPGASGGGDGLRLASAGGKPGWAGGGDGADGGESGVKSEKSAWTEAGNGVNALRGNIKKALARMEKEQAGLGAGAEAGDLQCAAAQRELHRSWTGYLKKVSGRCGTLRGCLEGAGSGHHHNNQAVADSFAALDKKYADTPAVGGGTPKAR